MFACNKEQCITSSAYLSSAWSAITLGLIQTCALNSSFQRRKGVKFELRRGRPKVLLRHWPHLASFTYTSTRSCVNVEHRRPRTVPSHSSTDVRVPYCHSVASASPERGAVRVCYWQNVMPEDSMMHSCCCNWRWWYSSAWLTTDSFGFIKDRTCPNLTTTTKKITVFLQPVSWSLYLLRPLIWKKLCYFAGFLVRLKSAARQF